MLKRFSPQSHLEHREEKGRNRNRKILFAALTFLAIFVLVILYGWSVRISDGPISQNWGFFAFYQVGHIKGNIPYAEFIPLGLVQTSVASLLVIGVVFMAWLFLIRRGTVVGTNKTHNEGVSRDATRP